MEKDCKHCSKDSCVWGGCVHLDDPAEFTQAKNRIISPMIQERRDQEAEDQAAEAQAAELLGTLIVDPYHLLRPSQQFRKQLRKDLGLDPL